MNNPYTDVLCPSNEMLGRKMFTSEYHCGEVIGDDNGCDYDGFEDEDYEKLFGSNDDEYNE